MRKNIYILAFLIAVFCALTIRSQNGEEKKDLPEDSLIIRAKVADIPEFLHPASDKSYTVVTYKVLEVCKGNYFDELIKVAHRGGSEEGLKVGDEMYLHLKPTERYRDSARSALEVFGYIVPEEFLADFDLVGDEQSCS